MLIFLKTITNSAELQLYAAKCITNLFRSSIVYQQQIHQQQLQHQQSQQQSAQANTPTEPVVEHSLCVLTSQHALIKLKTLPTLIRLASTYSAIYRGHVSWSSSNYSASSPYFYSNHLLSCTLANSTRPGPGVGGTGSYSHLAGNSAAAAGGDTAATRGKLVKLFGSLVLVDALATLSYLIELSADLQTTAAYLEQIIPALVANVSTGFNNLRFAGGNGVPSILFNPVATTGGKKSRGSHQTATNRTSRSTMRQKNSDEYIYKRFLNFVSSPIFCD